MRKLPQQAFKGLIVGGVVGAATGCVLAVGAMIFAGGAIAYAAAAPHGKGQTLLTIFGPLIVTLAIIGACVGLAWSLLFALDAQGYASAAARDRAARRGTIVQAAFLLAVLLALAWYLLRH